MTHFPQLAEWARDHAVALTAAVALVVVLTAVTIKRRGASASDASQAEEQPEPQAAKEADTETERRRKFSAGTLAAVAAFIICTSVSLNTGYRFTGAAAPKGLGMTWEPERILACAAFESLIAMCVLGARERLAKHGTPGWYGTAVWVFAGLSAVPAWAEGGGLSASTVVRIIVGSFGSALAAHSALGLELRHRTGDESQTAMAQITRDLRERLMARLGLAHRSRSAEEIARDRALDKAVDLDDRYKRLPDDEKTKRKGQQIARRLAVWQDRAELATNEAQRDLYRARVAQRQCATRLSISDDESPWNQPSATQVQARALSTLEGQAQHMEHLASDAEAALRAQIGTRGTPPAAHGGTPVPGPRAEATPKAETEADEEPADRIGLAYEEPAEPPKAAAAHGGTSRVITARVPQEGDEAETEEPEAKMEPLRDLRSYPTKRAALEALYRHRIAPDDPRTTNAIAEELRTELAEAGMTLDRGPANRYIGPLRPQQDETQEDQAEADGRELVNA